MCLVILLCTRANPQGPGFPCQGKGTDASGRFSCKGSVFPELRSPAGSPRWEQLSQALLGIPLGWVWLPKGGEEPSFLRQRVTMAAPQRQECGEREHHACPGGLLLCPWG